MQARPNIRILAAALIVLGIAILTSSVFRSELATWTWR